MSKLEDLIQKLCPNGVEWKELGELGILFSGLNGKSKKDFENGNQRFITYMNVFSNIELDLDMNDKVLILDNEKQNTLLYGDIIFTASSETREECGISSVMTKKTNDKLFLNSFCFGFRFYDVNIMLPGFSKYLFRADFMRKQIVRTASGVTRFNISKEKMKQIKIPIPPLEIQKEIVHILDSFTKLTNELTNELTSRKKQYEFYRDSLLTFGDEVEWKKLGEVCELTMGTSPKGNTISSEKNNSNIEFHQGKTFFGYSLINHSQLYTNSPIKIAESESVIMSVRAPVGDVNMTNRRIAIGRGLCSIIGKSKLNTKFLYYFINSNKNELKKKSNGSTFESINTDDIKSFKIPLPPLSEQERIVSILDKFDSLCNDITKGLPAEIEARKKQYEYYRDKLLTFKDISENK